MSLPLYFDEDAAEQVLILALRSRGIQVGTPHEVGLLGADDLVQLRFSSAWGLSLRADFGEATNLLDRGAIAAAHQTCQFVFYEDDAQSGRVLEPVGRQFRGLKHSEACSTFYVLCSTFQVLCSGSDGL